MAAVTVQEKCSFCPKARSYFDDTTLVLRPNQPGARRMRHPPEQFAELWVYDGAWKRFFDDVGQWARGLGIGVVVGSGGAAANCLPTAVLGQKQLVTLATGVLAAVAATAYATSSRSNDLVRFEIRFIGGARLLAKMKERELNKRLRDIYKLMAARDARQLATSRVEKTTLAGTIDELLDSAERATRIITEQRARAERGIEELWDQTTRVGQEVVEAIDSVLIEGRARLNEAGQDLRNLVSKASRS